MSQGLLNIETAVTLVIAFNTALKIDKNDTKRDYKKYGDDTKSNYKIYGDDTPLEPQIINVMDDTLVAKANTSSSVPQFEMNAVETKTTVDDLIKQDKLDDIGDTNISEANVEDTPLTTIQHRLDKLSDTDLQIIADAIENPSEPNDELKRAAQRYKEFMYIPYEKRTPSSTDTVSSGSKTVADVVGKKKVQPETKFKSIQTPWGDRYIDE